MWAKTINAITEAHLRHRRTSAGREKWDGPRAGRAGGIRVQTKANKNRARVHRLGKGTVVVPATWPSTPLLLNGVR